MKKAKEYAEQIISCKDEESLNHTINNTFNQMVNEIHDLGEQRKIQTNRALKSIVLEQKQKWSAICRIVNKGREILNEDGFIELLEKEFPMLRTVIR